MENEVPRGSQGCEEQQTRALREQIARLEAELRASRVENEALRQRFDAWIALISHDLRGPLTLILGHAENLLARQAREPPGGEGARAGLTSIVNGARRLNQMITQIVDGARADTGRLVAHPCPLELGTALHEEIRKWQRQHPDRTILARVPGSLPPIQADPRRVGQIIATLLSNAAIFAPADRPILASAQAVDASEILTVTDQGVGATREEIGAIFDNFYRPERLRKHPREGLGLSLANARHFARRMGGDLWAESPGEGLGMTFSLRLPMAAEPGGDNWS